MLNKDRTWVEINLKNIQDNYKEFVKYTNNIPVMAIVKANGYGHGSTEVCRELEKSGCNYFGVATIDESLELRKNGIEKNILLLNEPTGDKIVIGIEKDITFTVYSLEKCQEINKISEEKNKKTKIHIKINTGMNRVGIHYEQNIEVIKKIKKLKNLEVEGIYTHLAKADELNQDFTKKQFKRFKKILESLEKEKINIPIKHICNTAGTMTKKEMHLDMVRVGIGLYGHYPSEDIEKKLILLKPAMNFKSKIVQIKKIDVGEGVSYGLGFIADKETLVASVCVGYADGYTRMLSGKGLVEINGELAPVIGKICMDQMLIDITNIKNTKPKVGDEVTLFGSEKISVKDVGNSLNTINYEILCMVNRRVPRIYENSNVNYLI